MSCSYKEMFEWHANVTGKGNVMINIEVNGVTH
jgi:hypothetical protein